MFGRTEINSVHESVFHIPWVHKYSVLGGVGHCFAWHVRVNLGFYFSFKIEVLAIVHSGLCAM
jgi:hypothetical protein